MDPTVDTYLDGGDAFGDHSSTSTAAGSNHGWQKVTYAKRHRRQNQPAAAADPRLNGIPHVERSNVFATVDQKANQRRRAIESAAIATVVATGSTPVVASDDDEKSSDTEGGRGTIQENEAEGAKKVKQKKPKKPKITVQEAAAKIDASDLSAFLADVSVSYESQEDIQLMRLADYFGRAFSMVSASQFPWTKMFKESPLSKIVDAPIINIEYRVYKTSVDWIAQKSPDAVGDFVLWCLDGILADLARQQAAVKGSKISAQQPHSKSQVAIFVVLAMTLRGKPSILVCLLPKLRDSPKYQGQEKIPVIVWTVAQVAQVDILAGMHSWAHFLLPLICGKSGNLQTRSLALQLVERILAQTKSRSVLLNGATRKGESLVPPSALDLLMRHTFPVPSARVKATERFEEVYPILKELALAGSPGTKSFKQVSQEILLYAVKAMQENNPILAKEAVILFIWCLAQSPDCYKQWEKIYLDNMDASISVLQQLSDEWKEHSAKLSPHVPLRETLERLRAMNEESLSLATDAGNEQLIKVADKYCKALLGRITRSSSCLKTGVFVIVFAAAIGFILSPNMELFDGKKLHALLSSLQSP